MSFWIAWGRKEAGELPTVSGSVQLRWHWSRLRVWRLPLGWRRATAVEWMIGTAQTWMYREHDVESRSPEA